jgi:VanZ family protein
MIIIFSFSMQNGEESAGLSLKIVLFLQNHFPILKKVTILHFLVRKAAHMGEYGVLLLSFIYGFYKNKLSLNKVYLYSLLCTFLYACSDELHQYFVGGRAGQFKDVLIDTSGGIIMLIIIATLFHINKKRLFKSE